METQEKSSTADIFLRTIAVLGLIAVLLLGAWGIIELAVSLPGIFASIGGGVSSTFTSSAKESLAVSAPANAASGQSLIVSWNHTGGSGQYSYELSYSCQSGLSLKAPLPTGSYETVGCNTPFDFVNASGQMTVIPYLSGSASASMVVTVSATDLSTGAITTTGSATINVTSGAAQTTTVSTYTAPKTTTAYTAPAAVYHPATTRAALYGYPDLAVVYNSTIPNGSLTTITFTVENVGTNVTPSGWTFDAVLPINGSYTYQSQPQQALYPGDKIVYSLSFTNSYNNGYNYSSTGYSGQSYYTGYNYTGGGYTCNEYGPCDIPGYPTNYNYGTNYGAQYPTYINPNNGYTNGYGNGYSYGQNGVVTITVDPAGYIQELNKSNNTITIPLQVY